METLNLSLAVPAAKAATDASRGDCAGGSSLLLLVPTSRLPAARFFQGLAIECVLFFAVLGLAWLLGKIAAQQPTLNSARPLDNPVQIILYGAPPASKHPSDVSPLRVQRDESPRVSPPTTQPVGVPALGPVPTVTETRVDLPSQILEKRLPLPPMPAAALLQARIDASEAPTAQVPSLDPSPHHAAAYPKHGPNVGPDPLGLSESTGALFGHSSSIVRTGGRPPDLSPKPTRAAEREQAQMQPDAFTKPEILVMPKPMYPPTALAARVEGDAILQVTFDKGGRVIFRRFIHQLPSAEMNSVARETVERIKFIPGMRNGVPVDSDSIVTIFFRLTQLNITATF